MAQIPLNRFKTIRHELTTDNIGIYTCPTGVATIIILSQVTNTSTGVASVTAYHSRTVGGDFALAQDVSVPPQDSYNVVNDGRLVLETNDIFKIQADANNKLNIVLSILETAKQ
jgi:hypothetical protein